MRFFRTRPKAGAAIADPPSKGNSRGTGPVSHASVQSTMRSRATARLLLKAGQYLLLLVAFLCMGTVALKYVRSSLVQSYESRRLDRALGRAVPSHSSGVLAWFEHAYSVLTEKAGAELERNGASAPSADRAERRSPPATPALTAGTLVGRLEIPKRGISVMVLEGDDEGILAEAAGHVPSTALPGGAGNVAIAGHRDTFFRALRNIHRDDLITFATTRGIYEYRVESMDKVRPQDLQVLHASAQPTLTLITCYPFNYIGAAPMRFVVKAPEIAPSQSNPSAPLFAGISPAVEVKSPARITKAAFPTAAYQHGTTMEVAGEMAANEAPPDLKTAVAKHSEPSRTTAEESPDDPSSEPAAHSHKRFGKVRAWLASIPHHL